MRSCFFSEQPRSHANISCAQVGQVMQLRRRIEAKIHYRATYTKFMKDNLAIVDCAEAGLWYIARLDVQRIINCWQAVIVSRPVLSAGGCALLQRQPQRHKIPWKIILSRLLHHGQCILWAHPGPNPAQSKQHTFLDNQNIYEGKFNLHFFTADNWLFSYFISSTSEWIDLHQNFTDFVDLGSNYRWAVNVGHNPPLVDKSREDLQQFSGFVAFCRHLQISHSNIPNIWRHAFQVAHDQNSNYFSSTNILKTDPVFSTLAFNTIVQTTFCQILMVGI